MNTACLTAALAAALLVGESPTPSWLNDYSQGQQQGIAQGKPLAVVFGSGSNGWSGVVRADSPSADVSKLLAEKYICVYVDATTPTGQKLAQSFAMKGNVGIVLSDRAGTTQAFWHQGDLPNQALVSYLQKYSDPQVVVRGTETTSTRASMYPPMESEGTNWGATTGGSYCPSCNNVRGRR